MINTETTAAVESFVMLVGESVLVVFDFVSLVLVLIRSISGGRRTRCVPYLSDRTTVLMTF